MQIIHWASRTEPRRYHWCITTKDNGEPIGFAGADELDDGDMCCNLHYCLGRQFWGNGYATEAARAIIHYMLRDVGINRISAYHAAENGASGRVMEKAWMKYEGTARQRYMAGGTLHDAKIYAVTNDMLFSETVDGEFEFIDFQEDDPRLTDGELSLSCYNKRPADAQNGCVPMYSFDLKYSGEYVGMLDLLVGFVPALYYNGQVGYGIHPNWRGKGLAGRACTIAANVASTHGMSRLYINAAPDNKASRRVLEKLGADMVRVAEIPKEHTLYRGGHRMQCIYEYILPKRELL